MQKVSVAAVFAAISFATPAYAQQSAQTLSPTEAKAIATDAYLYAYPMLYNYKTLFQQRLILRSPAMLVASTASGTIRAGFHQRTRTS